MTNGANKRATEESTGGSSTRVTGIIIGLLLVVLGIAIAVDAVIRWVAPA